MTWEQLFQDIKAGDIQKVYCFHGPEDHIKRSAMAALRKKLLPEGLEALNHQVLEAPGIQQVIEAAETLPMMADRRLVEAWDWPPLCPGRAKAESEEAEMFTKWLGQSPDSACVVFYLRQSPDGRKKAMQQMQKGAAVVSFEPLPDDKLGKWVRDQLKPQGKKMGGQAIGELVFRAGRDLTKLSGELQKLAAYAAERDEVSVVDVEKLVVPSLESTVFQMIDQLLAQNQAGAQRLYKSMLEGGENRVGILFMLTRQMRNLLHVKQIRAAGLPLTEAEKRLGMPRFAAQRTEDQARRFSIDGLKEAYQACLDAEFDIKSGKVRDTLAVDGLVVRLGMLR